MILYKDEDRSKTKELDERLFDDIVEMSRLANFPSVVVQCGGPGGSSRSEVQAFPDIKFDSLTVIHDPTLPPR